MELFIEENNSVALYLRDGQLFYRMNEESNQWEGPYTELSEDRGMHFVLVSGEIKTLLKI